MAYKIHQHWPMQMAGTQTNPFCSDEFLSALETTQVCSPSTGWQPNHLQLGGNILAPCYIKSHSWGEYVFDHSWAHAYEQAGLHYYPKLVVAAPYTPSMGPRLLGVENSQQTEQLVNALKTETMTKQCSGFHILFPNAEQQGWLDQQPLLKRSDVQFHWYNRDFTHFDDFLATFSSRKRKNLRKERASIQAQNISIQVLEGDDISAHHWQAFYHFYHATYLKRGHQGYLNKSFFDAIHRTLKDQIVLVLAEQADTAVAAALFFKDNQTLYGRYWGCFEEFNNLHFEVCYYQGIDYCIKHGLQRFDPGTQGEHKIARGFEPTLTHSYHWLAHEQFFEAAQRFCENEAQLTQQYFQQTTLALPFKKPS